MKTINKLYQNMNDLRKFIVSNDIKQYDNILLQVFTGVCDIGFIENLISEIKSLVPHINIIGCTTSGEILEHRALEKSTVLSFSIFEKTKIKTYYAHFEKNSSQTAQKLLSQFDTSKPPKVAISFADGLHINGEEFAKSLSIYKKDLIISGGLAGDNAEFKQTITFTEEKILTDGAVIALLFNDDLSITTTASFGWESIGKTMEVTHSIANRVYEIDGIKAKDIYAKYLGEDIAKNLPKIGIEFPLIIKKENIKIPRAVLGKHDDGSLTFAGNINIGDKVTFGYGNVEAILRYSNNVRKQLSQSNLESIFIYSCMARKELMQNSISLELTPLSKIASVSGFFTYGEFYSDKATHKKKLLNETMTILAISENSNTNFSNLSSSTENDLIIKDRRKNSLTLKALSHLVSQTSLELEEINKTLEEKIKIEVKKSREKDKALIQQSKLAQMGEMIAMIAHQWRQPLGAITAITNDLILKITFNKYDAKYFDKKLKNITDLSQYLSKTIDDFREFYKKDKKKFKVLLTDIAKDVLNIVSTSIENSNIGIITEFNSSKKVYTYPNEVRQVILNLIKNAEDILLEKDIKNPCIKIKTYDDKNSSCLEVSDNGGGVPKNITDRIFDPYFSTKTQKDGTGLGLYMSKIIIEEHCGGRLSISNNNEGAVFKIELKG